MRADFQDATGRHWTDAESLRATARWANADHLYGLSAECALKCLMMAFGMPLDPTDGSPARLNDRKHANDLWTRYDAYRTGRPAGPAYALPTPNPFQHWAVGQRYAAESAFDAARVLGHRQGADTARALVAQARRDGILR